MGFFPFADPSLTLRRPFADPSQTLRRPFTDPSHKLRASAQGFGSGLRLRVRMTTFGGDSSLTLRMTREKLRMTREMLRMT